MTAENFYVWSDGAESGPYTREALMKLWWSGQLPAGFLWRADGDAEFRAPAEFQQSSPPAIEPKPVRVRMRPYPLSLAAVWTFAAVFFGLGISASFASREAGASIVSLAVLALTWGWMTTLLRGVSETRQLLGQISEQLDDLTDAIRDRR